MRGITRGRPIVALTFQVAIRHERPSPGRPRIQCGECIAAGRSKPMKTKARAKYYSPQLRRELISPLYHAAKAAGVPMTSLANRWVAEGLAKERSVKEDTIIYMSSKVTIRKRRR